MNFKLLILFTFLSFASYSQIKSDSTQNGFFKTFDDYKRDNAIEKDFLFKEIKLEVKGVKRNDPKISLFKLEGFKAESLVEIWGVRYNGQVYINRYYLNNQFRNFSKIELEGKYCYVPTPDKNLNPNKWNEYVSKHSNAPFFPFFLSNLEEYSINWNNGKTFFLNNKTMKLILGKYPDLLEKYKNDDDRYKKYKYYISKLNSKEN